MYTYFSNFFREGRSAQHYPIKEARDSNKVCAAVFTDLSKAFDCLLHNLPIAKSNAFGFDFKILRVIHAYLNDRIQVTKVGCFYSEILQIIYCVPQGSILDLLLLNVNLIDLLLAEHYKPYFSNYEDNVTPCNCRNTFFETISDLEITSDNLLNLLCYNSFKENASKCHLFLSPYNAKSINNESSVIDGSSSEKFLGIIIDSNFTFEKHTNELCKNDNLKLHALTGCAKFMSIEKKTPNIYLFFYNFAVQ